MKRFKTVVSLLLTATMFFSLAACGGKEETAETKQPTGLPTTSQTATELGGGSTTETAETGSDDAGRTDLIMGYTREPDSLAPGADEKTNAQMVVAMLHDTLVGKDPADQSNLVPNIAESWSFNEDGTVLTLKIRDDIKFHDGTPLTMDDVVYSLEYACAQPVNVAGAGMIESFRDAGDWNFEITLPYAYNPFLHIIAAPGFSIISKAAHEKALAEGKNFGTMENGTGAYKLVEWTTGDKMVLKANDEWHRGEVALKDVTVKLLSDETSGALMMENFEIDFFIGMNNADKDRLAANPEINMVDAPSAGTYCLLMNQNPGRLYADNLKLRQAVGHALNREEALIGGMNGVGAVTPGCITPGYFGYIDGFESQYDLNPEKAKALLAEAGYPDGLDQVFTMASDSWYNNPAQVIAEQLRQVGIRSEIEVMERAPFIEKVHTQMDYDMSYYMSWGDFPDADQQVYPKYHSSSIGANMGNHIGLNLPEVDKLVENARTSTSTEERAELYKQINQMNDDNAWYYWILTSFNAVCCDKDIAGVVPIPSGYYNPAFYSWN